MPSRDIQHACLFLNRCHMFVCAGIAISLFVRLFYSPCGAYGQEEASEDAAKDIPSPYAKFLEKNGVTPDGPGALDYLKSVSPTADRDTLIANLVVQLGAKSFRDRTDAEDRLARLGMTAEDKVREALNSDDPEVRVRAEAVMKRIAGTSGAPMLLGAIDIVRREKPEGVVEALLDALPLCEAPHLRFAAFKAIEETATAADEEILAPRLSDSSPLTRAGAAIGLAGTLGEQAAPHLAELGEDQDDFVALAAARCLAELGDRRCLAVLVRLLDAEDVTDRSHSACLLNDLTGESFGFVAYATPEERTPAAERWRQWLKEKGAGAELRVIDDAFHHRSYLGGHTLLAYGNAGRVEERDAHGTVVWEYACPHVWSAEKMANGNVLVASYSRGAVQEIDMLGQVVWECGGVGPLNSKPLPNGNVLIADHRGQRVVEIDRATRQSVWEHAMQMRVCDVQLLSNGNILVAGQNLVQEITRDHEVVWQWQGQDDIYSVQRLDKGNTLMAGIRGGRVFEVTHDQRVVWEYPVTRPSDAYRLPNGNTLITTDSNFMEISYDKQIMWKLVGCQNGTFRR